MKRSMWSKRQAIPAFAAPILFLAFGCNRGAAVDVPEPVTPIESDSIQQSHQASSEVSAPPFGYQIPPGGSDSDAEPQDPQVPDGSEGSPDGDEPVSESNPGSAQEGPNSDPSPAPVLADGAYEVHSAAQEFCWDIPNQDSTEGLNLQMFGCNDTIAQIFTFKAVSPGVYQIQSRISELYVSVRDSASAGNILEQRNLSSSSPSNQRFRVIPVANSENYILKPEIDSNLSVEVKSSDDNFFNDKLVLNTSSSSELRQQWIFVKIP